MQTSQPRMPQVIDSVACATTMLFGNGRQWTLEEEAMISKYLNHVEFGLGKSSGDDPVPED